MRAASYSTNRPANTRLLKPGVWVDDAGVDDNGNIYRLLGKKDLDTGEMPAPNVALVAGDVAFREYFGAHTDVPDWPAFLDYAANYFTAPAAQN